MADEKQFRRGVAALILTSRGECVFFQRNDFRDTWQGCEGGIDDGEDEETAVKREIWEEIGLEEKNYEILDSTSSFLQYVFPDEVLKRTFKNKFIGQEKKFFLVRLREGFDFNFKYDVDPGCVEMCDYKILPCTPALLEYVPSFKKEVYRQAFEYFKLFK